MTNYQAQEKALQELKQCLTMAQSSVIDLCHGAADDLGAVRVYRDLIFAMEDLMQVELQRAIYHMADMQQSVKPEIRLVANQNWEAGL